MIVRFTVIAVITGPIKQKCAASGYELLKRDDDLETAGGSIEEIEALERVVVGRLCQTPRRLQMTPYNSNLLTKFASAVLNRSSELLRVRSRRASGN